MLASGEYLLSLCSLGIAALGAISQVVHWEPTEDKVSKKSGAFLSIAGMCALMILVTVANKGDKPWSPTLLLIDSSLASRMPVAPSPTWRAPTPSVPRDFKNVHTEKSTWVVLQRELEELRKQEQHTRVGLSAPLPQPEGEVDVALAVGDDTSSVPLLKQDRRTIGTSGPSFDCRSPFVCYTEVQLKVPVSLYFVGKKYRRLFFLVGNKSEVQITKETVKINLSADDMATLKGISLYMPNQARDSQQHIGVEYTPNQTFDILPYRRANTPTQFVADLDVSEDTIKDFIVVFTIFAANLTAHIVPFVIHIVR